MPTTTAIRLDFIEAELLQRLARDEADIRARIQRTYQIILGRRQFDGKLVHVEFDGADTVQVTYDPAPPTPPETVTTPNPGG